MTSLHFVIDIETLGTTAGCPIFQIGAACQSIEELQSNGFIHTFYANPSIQSNIEYGLSSIDDMTLQWWARQPKNKFAVELETPDELLPTFKDCYEHRRCKSRNLKDCLQTLTFFIKDLQKRYRVDEYTTYYWCRGTDFDFPILRHAYEKVVKTWLMFPYYRCRDIRTIDDPIFNAPPHFKAVEHNALSDAIDELKILQAVINR